jgi:hypothetical protein
MTVAYRAKAGLLHQQPSTLPLYSAFGNLRARPTCLGSSLSTIRGCQAIECDLCQWRRSSRYSRGRPPFTWLLRGEENRHVPQELCSRNKSHLGFGSPGIQSWLQILTRPTSSLHAWSHRALPRASAAHLVCRRRAFSPLLRPSAEHSTSGPVSPIPLLEEVVPRCPTLDSCAWVGSRGRRKESGVTCM